MNIELIFLVSNLSKFAHGGWFPLAVSVLIFGLLYLYYKARQLRGKYEDFTTADKLVPVLDQIQQDKPFHMIIPTWFILPVRHFRKTSRRLYCIPSLFLDRKKQDFIGY